jgi:ActR/RegA family two-component response regulator
MTTLAAARDALSAAGEVRRAAEGDHARATAEVVALVRRDDARIPRRDRAVLVVDDSDAERTTLTEALRARLPGVVVDAADGPLAADVCLRRRPYAVVVVDYHLGRGRSGAEYVAELDRGVRPLIVTGRADVDALRRIASRVDVPVYSRPVDARDWDALAGVVGGMVDDATG